MRSTPPENIMSGTSSNNLPSAKFIQKFTETGWKDPDLVEKYHRAEKITRPFADLMLQQVGLREHDGDLNIFDLACGTGAAIAALYEAFNGTDKKLKVLGGDHSEAMLDYLRDRAQKEGWEGLEVRNIDGANIQLQSNTYTHLLINFGIFMMPPATLTKCHDILQPNGFIAMTTWDHLPWYPLVARAINSLPSPPYCPSVWEVESEVYRGQTWQDTKYVQEVLVEHGFQDVQIRIERRRIGSGTPKEFSEMMHMPLRLISGHWEEEKREEVIGEVKEALEKVVEEEVGGKDKLLFLEWAAIVATGRKAG
ncbi:S-adenosyl-L-methionine-dependent methyltransferase [Zopfia rhizophila CBS 207.26]|uniref:S-adenosyl-L-methionine-dependent methyltransferase n=1 Tax=Zopfia rhizophila CBS 207.26 TaxID=1314779 RepID=A0A6A6E673_9PEZI|nr:S-adenosyl-L-methionine-dependent methyltransferase [Zopfia rhizophila CBS 207.26]